MKIVENTEEKSDEASDGEIKSTTLEEENDNQIENCEEENDSIQEELNEEQDDSEDEEEDDENTVGDTEDQQKKFDKEEYVYQKLIKKRNHVYSCIANVLKNYNRKTVLDEFIPEREKIAMSLATILMTKDGISNNDFSNLSTVSDGKPNLMTTNEIIALSAINFLINQVYLLTKPGEGELTFTKETKDHLTELAIEWAKLRDQAFMFSNGMIQLEYELHDEFHFIETELYHETEKKLKSIGISQQSTTTTKLAELRDQRRKRSDRTINELNDLVRSWHSEIAYLRRITEFYASMRQLTEEEVEIFSLLFENFGALMELKDLKKTFKEIKISKITEMQEKRAELDPLSEKRLAIYEATLKFEIGKENVPYFLCRKITKNEEEYLQIPIISLLLFARFCNSYSETTRSRKAHDLELIVSEIAMLAGWEVVDQNVEILSEGDTVTEIDLIIKRNKVPIIIEVKDLALWRGWYFDRESLIKRYEIFTTAAKKLRERRLLLKKTNSKMLIVTALNERWKKVDGIPIVPLKALAKYLKKLKRIEGKRSRPIRRR